MVSNQRTQRQCVSCGRSIDWNANICQYCGHDYRSQAHVAQPPKKNHPAFLIIAIVVIVVVIVVVLPLLLYIMVIGVGGTSIDGPTAVYQKATITNGQKITIVGITKFNCPWDDFKVQLSERTNIAEWSPTSALQISPVGHNYSTSTALAGLTVCLWIYDQSGDGFVNDGDYFTLFTYGGAPGFSHDTVYSAVLLWEPNGELCGQPVTFTG